MRTVVCCAASASA